MKTYLFLASAFVIGSLSAQDEPPPPPNSPTGFNKQDEMEQKMERERYKQFGQPETQSEVEYYKKVAPQNPEKNRNYFQEGHPIEANPQPAQPLQEAPIPDNPIPSNPID